MEVGIDGQSGPIVQWAVVEVSDCASETVPSLQLNGVAENAKDRVSKGSIVTHMFAHVSYYLKNKNEEKSAVAELLDKTSTL